MHNYDIFVAKIYDYALIDSFEGFPRFIDSPTSYATLVLVYGSYIQVQNLGANWLRLLVVTLIMVLVLVYGSYTQVPNLGANW